MLDTLLIVLVVLTLFVFGILAATGLRHAFRRLAKASMAFVAIFVVVFLAACWAVNGTIPALPDIPSSVSTPEFWAANWIGLGLGVVCASVSARYLMTRKV